MSIKIHCAFTAIFALAISGCATNGGPAAYRPMVDIASIKDQAQYERDLADCQAYARRIDPARQAAAGAVMGALLGAALGVAIGDSSSFARAGATSGAVGGAVGAGANAAYNQVEVIKRCVAGRGYSVLM